MGRSKDTYRSIAHVKDFNFCSITFDIVKYCLIRLVRKVLGTKTDHYIDSASEGFQFNFFKVYFPLTGQGHFCYSR
jgi:hypothetical protein